MTEKRRSSGKKASRAARVDPRINTPKDTGRPPHEPTRATRGMVRMLLLLRRTQDEISAAMGIDGKTLRKHYQPEIETARLNAFAALTQTAMLRALGGSGEKAKWQDADPGMLRFMMDRLGVVAPPVQAHLIGSWDLSKLTDEQLAQMDALAVAAAAGGDPSGDDEA